MVRLRFLIVVIFAIVSIVSLLLSIAMLVDRGIDRPVLQEEGAVGSISVALVQMSSQDTGNWSAVEKVRLRERMRAA